MLPHISIKSERDREPVLGTSHLCWGPWVVMGTGFRGRRLHRLLELNRDDLISPKWGPWTSSIQLTLAEVGVGVD